MNRSITFQSILCLFIFAGPSPEVAAQALLTYLQCEDAPLQGPVEEIRRQDPLGNWTLFRYDRKGRVYSLSRSNHPQVLFFQYDDQGQIIASVEKEAGLFVDSTVYRYNEGGDLMQTYYFLGHSRNLYETWHYHYDSKNRPYFTVQSRINQGILQIETAIYQSSKNKVDLYTNEDWRTRTRWYYENSHGCINPIIRYIKNKDGQTISAYTKVIEPGKTKATEVLIEFENDIYGNWIKKTSKFIRGKRQEVFLEEKRMIKYWDEN